MLATPVCSLRKVSDRLMVKCYATCIVELPDSRQSLTPYFEQLELSSQQASLQRKRRLKAGGDQKQL